MIIEDAEEFQEEKLIFMTRDEIKEWMRRREWFLNILEGKEEASGLRGHPISWMMRSRRSFFASILDAEAILGLPLYFDEKHIQEAA
jgi:hypothetical protein